MIDVIDTIDTIDIIDCIGQYEDNWYYQSDPLSLQTSPTQLQQCWFLFRFEFFIKLRSIAMFHPVSSCWYAHLWFLVRLCFSLNTKVVPTAEVGLLSQIVMAYCCVSRGKTFLPGFLLLTDPYSCVPGDINCNNKDLAIVSSLTQDDYHQRSYFTLSIWKCDKVNKRDQRGNK